MENIYTIRELITAEEITSMIDIAVKDGVELARADGIEFEINYDTSNGNTTAVNDYKHRLVRDDLNAHEQSIINKYKAM